MTLGGEAGRVFLATVIGLWAYPIGLAIAVPVSFALMMVTAPRLSSMGLLIVSGAATLAAVLSPWIPILVYTGPPLS